MKKNTNNTKQKLFEIMDKVNGTSLSDKTEYWTESSNGQGYFQETKEEFYKSINAGFRGFIKYENGKEYWITNKK